MKKNPSKPYKDWTVVIADNRDDTGAVSVSLMKDGEYIDDAYAEIPIVTAKELQREIRENNSISARISDKGNLAYLSGIELPEQLRKLGIGSAMIKDAMKFVAELNIKVMYLVTSDGALVEYYERLGFEEIDYNNYGQSLMRASLK